MGKSLACNVTDVKVTLSPKHGIAAAEKRCTISWHQTFRQGTTGANVETLEH